MISSMTKWLPRFYLPRRKWFEAEPWGENYYYYYYFHQFSVLLLYYIIRGLYYIFEINSYPNLFKRSFFFFVYERRVNFKKYEKTNLPNFDHLMNSSVYKMIHKMEKEPKRGIPARPAKVNAAEDIIERVVSIYIRSEESLSFKNFLEAKRFLKNEPSPAFLSFQKSPAFSIADDRSTRSVSHWTVAKKG